MPGTWIEKITSTPEGMADFQREKLTLLATERICQLMDDQGVNWDELARRIGTTRRHVVSMLDGRGNLPIQSLSDMLVALGRVAVFDDRPLPAPAPHPED